MQNVIPLKVHLDVHLKLTLKKGDPLPDPSQYQKLMGKLLHLTTTIHISFFLVHLPIQFLQNPTIMHMQTTKLLLRYLTCNPTQEILFASQYAPQLITFCDSDWSSCVTSTMPTTRFCILLGQLFICRKSKKQPVVSRSPIRAESSSYYLGNNLAKYSIERHEIGNFHLFYYIIIIRLSCP